ncbi:MAG: murein biosynthesis integral membrane protein MurJ [Chloroflexi bacterium RBG_16_64_43]|nr:MAG: murein biosynthesis integral membrane protein MurJ [Chloroflexi bacterium RBG_16_64_43]
MKSLARSSLLVAFFFGLDKAIGLARQLLVARQFGMSPELDAFNAANNVPDLLFALISGGALSLAFIPVLTETLEQEGRAAAWRLFSRVANWAFLITAVISIGLAFAAEPIVAWRLGVAPGFSSSQQALVAQLMRLNLIATLIFSVSGLVISGLQARQHFVLPALAPVLYNVGLIAGVVVLAPEHGWQVGSLRLPAFGLGIQGMVYGVILGALLHLAIQIPGLVRYGFRWSASLTWRDERVRRVARLMGPRVLTLGAIQLVFVLTDNLASYMPAGAVSALVYGWVIMQVPETVIGTAIGTVLLPRLAERLAHDDSAGFNLVTARGVRLILVFTLPAAIALGLILPTLVPWVFRFDAEGTRQVTSVAQMFLVGLAGHALLEVAARTFYARQDARTPLTASLLNFGVFLALAPLLARQFGAAGIALANSISFTLEALLLLGWGWRRGQRFAVGGALARAALAVVVVLAIGLGAMWLAPGSVPGALAGAAISAGIVVLIAGRELRGWASG